MKMSEYFTWMVEHGASDLILSVGAPPAARIEGHVQRLEESVLSAAQLEEFVEELFDATQRASFVAHHELNVTVPAGAAGRFRINAYRQRGETALAVRLIPAAIPSIEELHLPSMLKQLILAPRGLVLIVGANGSGKSTTLAAMIAHRNHSRTGHIVTIEEPIEFLHAHDQSIVDQREVGADTDSVAEAMRNALRESTDVIVIGEIRDAATMEQAIRFALSGQLCVATLHATNAAQAIDRILGFFPVEARAQRLLDLSTCLQAVISQRLLPSAKSRRRVPAVELLLHSAHVSDLIAKGETGQLHEAMKQGIDEHMLTFEESLLRLYHAGDITLEDALANADSETDLKLRVRLSEPLTLAKRDVMTVDRQAPEPRGDDASDGWIDDGARANRV